MTQWTLVDKWKNKPQGQVWRVKSESGELAYFKFAYPEQWYDAGPITGNEWLTRQLAKRVGLPCARVQRATLIDGGKTLRGIVSLPRVHRGLTSWAALPDNVKRRAEAHVNKVDLLAGTVAFDSWLTNIDRGSGHNVILFPALNGKYNWYLIDHGYCLYGCPRKWKDHHQQDAYWRQVWKFYHIPQGWQRLANKRRLMLMVARIRAIPEAEIRKLVNSVPDPLYSSEIRRDTIDLLITRQRQLERILDTWLRYSGKKESSL